MDIQFAYTILYVADVQATLDFYVKAFAFVQKFITPEKDYGELISGSTTLAFASHELGRSNFPAGYTESDPSRPPFGMELAFTTSDVAGVMQKALDAGATLASAATQKPWGQTVGYVRDINGFLVEVCTPIGG